jgi:TM2 domain-containing membrane protein YozV
MNLNFSSHALFSWYVVLLLVSGAIMLVLAAVRVGQRPAGRIINLIFGLGFLGYGIYLGFIFTGGTYFLFFKAFIVPVVLLIGSARSAMARRRAQAAAATAVATPPATPGQPG